MKKKAKRPYATDASGDITIEGSREMSTGPKKVKKKVRTISKDSADSKPKAKVAVEKGDFLIVENGRNVMMRVVEVDGKTITGIDQKMKRTTDGQYEKRDPFSVKASQVILNLGKSPRAGSVYGVKIEPLYKRVNTETCGQILFFVDVEEEQRKMVRSRCIKMWRRFEEKNLGGVPLQIEIRPAQGKYAGWYKFFPRADSDVLCLKPNFDMVQPKDFDYLIAHEYAHGIWYRMMSPSSIAAWIALYDKHMAPIVVGEDELQELLAGVHDTGSVRGFIKQCEEEDKAAMRAVLRTIRQVHGVDAKHLDFLLRDGMTLEGYWPSQVTYSDKGVLLTDYARTSPEELWAEAFAYWFTGQNVPKSIRKLIERSLSKLSRGRVNSDEDVSTDRDHDDD